MNTSRVIRWAATTCVTVTLLLFGGCADPPSGKDVGQPAEPATPTRPPSVEAILDAFPREPDLHGYQVIEVCTARKQRDCTRLLPALGGFLSATRSGKPSDNSSVFITVHRAPKPARYPCDAGRFMRKAQVQPDGSFTPGERGVGRIKEYAHAGVRGRLCLRTFVYLEPDGAIMEWADEAETVVRLGDWELHVTASEGSGPDGKRSDDDLAIALTNDLVGRLHHAER